MFRAKAIVFLVIFSEGFSLDTNASRVPYDNGTSGYCERLTAESSRVRYLQTQLNLLLFMVV